MEQYTVQNIVVKLKLHAIKSLLVRYLKLFLKYFL